MRTETIGSTLGLELILSTTGGFKFSLAPWSSAVPNNLLSCHIYLLCCSSKTNEAVTETKDFNGLFNAVPGERSIGLQAVIYIYELSVKMRA